MTEEAFSDGHVTHSPSSSLTLAASLAGLSPIKSPIMIEGNVTERDRSPPPLPSNTQINNHSDPSSNTQTDLLYTQPDLTLMPQ